MKSLHRICHPGKAGRNGVWWALSWFAVTSVIGFPIQAAPNITLFDTGSPFPDRASRMDRSHWTSVPGDLLKLEADPVKSASDPGYYGREYVFKGDAVVENRNYLAVFWATQGRVTLYAPPVAASLPAGKSAEETFMLGRVVAELTPLSAKTSGTTISRCDIVRNVGDEVVVEAFFSADGAPEVSVMFSFGKTEIVEVKPSDGLKGVRVLSPIEYGVAPNFLGDDLIFGPAEYPTVKSLTIPANNILVGLLRGEDHELVMTWPQGKQHLRLGLGADSGGKRHFEAIEFEAAGQSFYLALLSAHGIWHREALTPAYLEKDVTSAWQRPFPAKWVTQLDEADVRTTFTFRDSKAQIWRGVPGSYNYPVWFTGGQASYHLSKKVPPTGESLVYFVEGAETPSEISAPVDILKATLGPQQA